MKLLDIDSLFNLLPALDGWLAERLTRTKLLHGSSLLEFTLEALQGPFNILAFFDGYYDHAFN